MKKLTKWQWTGLALSGIWIVSILYSEYSSASHLAENVSSIDYRLCAENQSMAQNLSLCESEKNAKYNSMMSGQTKGAILAALLPLPFLWLYGFLILTAFRCFKHGYKNVINIQAMSTRGKAFAYFCYFYLGLTFLVIVTGFMNEITDNRVPVSLGYSKGVYQSGDYVSAKGTWTSRSGMSSDSNMIFPLQTSEIVCTKIPLGCFESRAEVSMTGGSAGLMAEQIIYQVENWNANRIVYRTVGLCYTTIYTIDLVAKTVTGVEKYDPISADPTFCKPPKNDRDPVTYTLEDGFKVYWELRKQSRPWLLRVIQSLFGN